MLEGRHKDTAEPKVAHKSGWFFQTFHFKTDSKGEFKDGIEIKACDYEHAIKQAKAWGRRCGFKVVEGA